ncbi:transposase [Gluconobacter cerinus]|uniref:transposase n=1 Tax=Gluconobacter cerinus TaxID=38307 RepID=UPI0039ED0BA5
MSHGMCLPERTMLSCAISTDLAKCNIQAVIPGRSNRRVTTRYERTLYNQRYRIERMFGRLKINHAIATRYDQLAASFMSMVHISTARDWLKFVHAASPINLKEKHFASSITAWAEPVRSTWC